MLHRGCSVGYFASFSAFVIAAAYLTRDLDRRRHAIGSICKEDLPTPPITNRPDDDFGQRATERDMCSRRLERAAQHSSAVQYRLKSAACCAPAGRIGFKAPKGERCPR